MKRVMKRGEFVIRRRANPCCTLLVVCVLLLPLFDSSSASAAEPEQASRTEVQSVRGLSQVLLRPSASRSQRRRGASDIRKRLTDLRSAIGEVANDPSPARVTRMRNRKAAAVQACKGLRDESRNELASLWREVDYASADPIGQRARLDTARQHIDAALEQPTRVGGPSMTVLLDLANPDER